jgi:hypothetical protein
MTGAIEIEQDDGGDGATAPTTTGAIEIERGGDENITINRRGEWRQKRQYHDRQRWHSLLFAHPMIIVAWLW